MEEEIITVLAPYHRYLGEMMNELKTRYGHLSEFSFTYPEGVVTIKLNK